MRLIRGALQTLRRFRPLLLLEVSDAALKRQSSSDGELLETIRSLGYQLYQFDFATGLPPYRAHAKLGQT